MSQGVSAQRNPLKTFFPIYGMKGGGAERIVVTLVNHMDRSRFEPVLVLLDVDGEYLAQVNRDVRVIRLHEDVKNPKPVETKRASPPIASPEDKIDLREAVRGYLRERLPPPWVNAYRRLKRAPRVQQGIQTLSLGVDGSRTAVKELRDATVLAGKGIRGLVRRVPRLRRLPAHWARRIVRHRWESFGILKEVTHYQDRLQPHFEGLLDRERPEAIVAHLLLGNSVALQAGPERDIFTVVCMHNTLRDYQTREEYRNSPLGKADAIVTVSHAIGGIFRERFGNEKVRVIHNPHDLARIQALSKEAVSHPWFEQKELPVVMGIGRLSRQKNFSMLVEAVCGLNRDGVCPVRLVLFGEGPERGRLMRRIRRNGQEERIRLMGWTTNPFRYLARADLFVLCSDWEGLPNTLIEAMACGVPVISTDCHSGPREILQDGVCGRLVARGDVVALREAMVEILRDSQKAEAFRRRAMQRAWEFDISVQVPRYEKLILEGVGARHHGQGIPQLPAY
jgi:glycosyltransferase involved in cell wall biosynthesis